MSTFIVKLFKAYFADVLREAHGTKMVPVAREIVNWKITLFKCPLI